MHKGYVRRTIFLWIFSLIWVLLGIFFFSGTVKGYIGGESLYKAGDIYHLNDAGTSVAIRVLDIDSESLTYDGKEYYLVKHENGVTPLQASAKDIQQLLDLKKENPEGWEPLKEANIYLNVRVTPAVTKGRRGSTTVHIPAVLLDAFATQYKKEKEKEKNTDSRKENKEKPKVKEKPKEQSKDKAKEQPKVKSTEQAKEKPKEKSKTKPKEQVKDKQKEQPKEKSKGQSNDKQKSKEKVNRAK